LPMVPHPERGSLRTRTIVDVSRRSFSFWVGVIYRTLERKTVHRIMLRAAVWRSLEI
jgi:hypothetical protein